MFLCLCCLAFVCSSVLFPFFCFFACTVLYRHLNIVVAFLIIAGLCFYVVFSVCVCMLFYASTFYCVCLCVFMFYTFLYRIVSCWGPYFLVPVLLLYFYFSFLLSCFYSLSVEVLSLFICGISNGSYFSFTWSLIEYFTNFMSCMFFVCSGTSVYNSVYL